MKFETPQWFDDVVDWFYNGQKEILRKHEESDDGYWFDYPEYGGMSKRVSSKLPPDFVDFLQEEIDTLCYYKQPLSKAKIIERFISYGIIPLKRIPK